MKRLAALFLIAASAAFADSASIDLSMTVSNPAAMLTQHNDNFRTGLNSSETILTATNVNAQQFGELFSLPVDGAVYAQPLYVPGIAVNGAIHNLLITATENDSVYAFDADAAGAPLWKASLVDTAHGAQPGETPLDESQSTMCTDIAPTVGITSTPVIDSEQTTIYVEAESSLNFSYFHRLHAIDIATGAEQPAGPVRVAGSVPGTGLGSTNGVLPFFDLTSLSRAGLLLSSGNVYVAYGSLCDKTPAAGWLFGYDAKSLAPAGVFVTTPNGSLGTFWAAGAGLAADSDGLIYAATGNGSFDAVDVGDSIIKLSPVLSLTDSFTPYDQDYMQANDADLGSGDALVLPDQPLIVQAGKRGRIYLLNSAQLTAGNLHYCNGCSADSQIIQETATGFIHGEFGSPAYWNQNVYFWGAGDVLTRVPIAAGMLDLANVARGSQSYSFPGAGLAISSNGTASAIVWANGRSSLAAYDAQSLAQIWQSAARGPYVQFSVPTVANGKVYLGSNGEVDAFGLIQ